MSSHVDCEAGITRCFTRLEDNGLMRGTYDNAITNAAALYAMLSGGLPDDIMVCFTGDEEYGGNGASGLAHFLRRHSIDPRGIAVLDVTDMGWKEESDFTIENDFWSDSLGRKVASFAGQSDYRWMYVPGELDNISA